MGFSLIQTRAFLSLTILTTLFLSPYAQTCSNYAFQNNMVFTACNDLPVLNSYLHYTFTPSTKTLQIAYRVTNIESSKWVAWAINPTSQGMTGSQALVAFQSSDGSMNVLSGQATSVGGASGSGSKTRKRNIHGLLNAISWGIMMPVGAIIARYLRVFQSADPAWFYLHVTCQTSAYVTGVAGWATGIRLGSQSPGMQYTSHRVIGIILFCVATLQVIALLVRPKKEHKHRIFWNIYHHSLGYTIIILGIINIFKGFDILNPEKKWERAYTGVIVVIAIVAAVLEAYTWVVVIRRKKSANATEKMNNGNGYASNGNYGHYPYSDRTNGRV